MSKIIDLRIFARWTAALFMVALVSACASNPAPQADGNSETPALAGTHWQLLRIEQADGSSEAASDKQPSTLAFDEQGRFAGKAACNNYFGKYKRDNDGSLHMGHAGATLMACQRPNLAHDLLTSLPDVSHYKVVDDELHLFAGNTQLIWKRDSSK